MRAALEARPGRRARAGRARPPGGARFDVILTPTPTAREAFDLVPALRGAAKAAGGAQCSSAARRPSSATCASPSARDNRVIVPIALLVVFVILAALLRAVVAPLILIGTVILSFAAALGVGIFFFDNVFDFPGIDPSLPLFAFVFLVALGVDYNIFLMARVREESLRWARARG